MLDSTEHSDGQHRNAALSWALVLVLVATVAESLLDGEMLWAGFSATVVAVALVPAVVSRDPTVLVTWEVLLLSALPGFANLIDVFVEPLGYVAVAALALLVVAEIHAFSSARMAPWFAALFVVLTTLTVAAAWAIVRYAADVAVGTAYLDTGNALMWELVAATGVGIAAGLLFGAYCSERGSIGAMVGYS